MSKKPTVKSLRNRADKLWSQLIRSRGCCERCGRRPPQVTLQGAHIIPRRYLKTRWDLRNGLSLCAADHVYFTHYPLEFEDFVLAHVGADTYQELRRKALDTAGKVDYQETVAELKAKLEVMA